MPADARERQHQHQLAVGRITDRDGDGVGGNGRGDIAIEGCEPARRLERGRARARPKGAILRPLEIEGGFHRHGAETWAG